MTYTFNTARLATTAIAAVLALSATPLIAQDVPPPDTTSAPPAATTPDPLAPEPAASEPAAEPAPATTATETTETKPTAKPKAKAATRTVSKAPAPVRPAEPATAAGAPAVPAEPVEAAPIVDVTRSAEPAPPAPAQPAAATEMDMDEVVSIAGAGALALLGLTGAAVALRRRKRRREDVLAEEQAEQAQAEPVLAEPRAPIPVAAAPVATVAPRHDPVFADKPKTALPEGFDLSRFGRHVQAAYRGPTADNPSLSLKYRLRRASALDQRERIEGTAGAETRTVESRTVKAPAQRPMVHSGGDFLFGGPGPKTVVRPAYSKAD